MKSIYCIWCFVLFFTLQVIADNFLVSESMTVCLYLLITSLGSHKFNINLKYLFAPQNFAFIIFFFRLYVIPCIAIFYGYPSPANIRDHIEANILLQNYIILLFTYLSFIIGWIYFSYHSIPPITPYKINHKTIYIISTIFFLFGIISLILQFKNISTYLSNIYLEVSEEMNESSNKALLLCSSLAKYFIPFAIFGYLTLINFNYKNFVFKYAVLGIAFVLIVIFSLNSNRQSMVYPVLTLLAAFSPKILKIKAAPTILTGIIGLYFLFAFSNIRTSKNASLSDALMHSSELAKTVELYAGGAHLITPVVEHNEFRGTIIPSFLHSIPVIGKPFRESSGLTLYNYLYFNSSHRQDLVFHTHSECYMNGGYTLIILFFSLVGYIYAYLNHVYLASMSSQLLFRAAIFYITILFNSVILLSFQVLGQFLFYNAIPAIIIIFLYHKNRK